MGAGNAGELVARGYEAAAAGEWPVAREAFAAALGLGDGPEAMFGLGDVVVVAGGHGGGGDDL
jgi:hypothetical protein